MSDPSPRSTVPGRPAVRGGPDAHRGAASPGPISGGISRWAWGPSLGFAPAPWTCGPPSA